MYRYDFESSRRSDWDLLLLAARQGDVDSLGQLLELASDDLRDAAGTVLGRATLARLPVEDVFADALIAVLREIGSLRATNYVGFRYWFTSIARNLVRRTLRNERTRGTRVEEQPDDGEAERERKPLSPEALDCLRALVARLPRTQQVAFVLREGLGLSWISIGFVLERRQAPAARLIHYRAVLRLKDFATVRPDLRTCLALQA